MTQYVLLGAGFDSFALRTPPEARYLRILEIDHPATQALKMRCIAAAGVALRPEVHFLAADLALVARYDPQNLNRLQPSERSRIAHARVNRG